MKKTTIIIVLVLIGILIIIAVVFWGSKIMQNDNLSKDSTPVDSLGINLKLVADNLVTPIALLSPDDGSKRIFIVDQIGLVKILDSNGEILTQPFLDLRKELVKLAPNYDERGLLGLAFHPNFKDNGRLFVYYSTPLRKGAPAGFDSTVNLAEFTVDKTDINKVDPNSKKILLQIDEPQSNHNAGKIAFGPDGFLYIPTGDGGGANDAGSGHSAIGNGQDKTTLLGKILRIDVNKGNPYSIPNDNPFTQSKEKKEIFAYGFRNPFHISFDTAGGDQKLIVGDAGQNLWEEVSVVTKGGNFGWNVKEGRHCFDAKNPDVSLATCPDQDLSGEKFIDPVLEYKNIKQAGGLGSVVLGGYVYRGNALPQTFIGKYFFGDFSKSFSTGDGTLLLADPSGSNWTFQELPVNNKPNKRMGTFLHGFGEDYNNELYIFTTDNLGPSGNTGKIYQIVP